MRTATADTPPPVPPGIRCRNPKCGGTKWSLVWIRHRAGKVVRRRQCCGCGRRITTYEREAGA